ncbi:MAG: sigma-70 family RNA polymerase sigma factor [Eubacterium sp.]|nr:sigma-70 family RNA polymerase sigma factor [Eubacterium sp.]
MYSADFSGYTDEQLAAGDIDGSEKELVRRYMAPVRIKARAMAKSYHHADADDLFSEGLLGLLKAIRHYDAGKGASFATFADICVSNSIKTALSKLSRGGEMSKDYDFDFDKLIDAGASTEDTVIDRDLDNGLYERLSQILTERELEVLWLYLKHYSYKSAAKKLGTDEKSVDNALQRAKAKIKRYLGK